MLYIYIYLIYNILYIKYYILYIIHEIGVTMESASWELGLATGRVSALMAPMRAGLVDQMVKVGASGN